MCKQLKAMLGELECDIIQFHMENDSPATALILIDGKLQEVGISELSNVHYQNKITTKEFRYQNKITTKEFRYD